MRRIAFGFEDDAQLAAFAAQLVGWDFGTDAASALSAAVTAGYLLRSV
jgi:hypothetical protein